MPFSAVISASNLPTNRPKKKEATDDLVVLVKVRPSQTTTTRFRNLFKSAHFVRRYTHGGKGRGVAVERAFHAKFKRQITL